MDTKELLKLKARDVMSHNPLTVNHNSTMVEVDNLIQDSNIHHVPVLNDEQNLVGIICKSDMQLLKNWGTNLDIGSAKRKNLFLLKSQLASDVMHKNIVTVSVDDTVIHCANLFGKNEFQSLPVVEKGKLIGIITTFDLINAAYT